MCFEFPEYSLILLIPRMQLIWHDAFILLKNDYSDFFYYPNIFPIHSLCIYYVFTKIRMETADNWASNKGLI